MKNTLSKKIVSSIVAFAMVVGMTAAGSVPAKAAEDKAIAVPIKFIGVSQFYENDFESSTVVQLHFDPCQITPGSSSFGATAYIPQAALEKVGSAVAFYFWSDIGVLAEGQEEPESWSGLNFRYDFAIANNKGKISPVVTDRLEWRWLDASEIPNIVSVSKSGDFYKVVFKNISFLNTIRNYETDEETTFETVTGPLNVSTRITGLANQLDSVAYFDDIEFNTASGTVSTNFSDGVPLDYSYVIADDWEHSTDNAPCVTLNTSLLKLAKNSGTVKVKKTLQIKATAAGGSKITYKTSDKKVATVTSKGKIKGIKEGTATITVSANGTTKTFKVTVTK